VGFSSCWRGEQSSPGLNSKKKKKDIINKNEGKELIIQEIRIRKKGLCR
jgi:hypothetical protein